MTSYVIYILIALILTTAQAFSAVEKKVSLTRENASVYVFNKLEKQQAKHVRRMIDFDSIDDMDIAAELNLNNINGFTNDKKYNELSNAISKDRFKNKYHLDDSLYQRKAAYNRKKELATWAVNRFYKIKWDEIQAPYKAVINGKVKGFLRSPIPRAILRHRATKLTFNAALIALLVSSNGVQGMEHKANNEGNAFHKNLLPLLPGGLVGKRVDVTSGLAFTPYLGVRDKDNKDYAVFTFDKMYFGFGAKFKRKLFGNDIHSKIELTRGIPLINVNSSVEYSPEKEVIKIDMKKVIFKTGSEELIAKAENESGAGRSPSNSVGFEYKTAF